jgi:hypothetical protein
MLEGFLQEYIINQLSLYAELKFNFLQDGEAPHFGCSVRKLLEVNDA